MDRLVNCMKNSFGTTTDEQIFNVYYEAGASARG
jgi:hypothetical protein